MKNIIINLGILLLLSSLLIIFTKEQMYKRSVNFSFSQTKDLYWFELARKSNIEFLYFGVPQDRRNSWLLKVFIVKSGIPKDRPTPLPSILGKEYWLITDKFETKDNPETAPYFLTLNIPVSEEPPYGPTPYLECNGQCDWVLPGAFGLHGVNRDNAKLSDQNPGSSGCIRHYDDDITYLYNLLDTKKEEIRYYIVDK